MNNGKILNGLLTARADFSEVDKSSIFEISIPHEFGFGKNEVKINLTSNMVRKGSEVLIDVLDASSNPIFYEISPIVNVDKSRSIIVKIDDDVVEGYCKFILLSTLSDGILYKCILNINVVKSVGTSAEIKFTTEPVVEYKERLIPTQKFTSVSRLVNRTFPNGTISMQSSISPKQISSDALLVEVPELVNRDVVNSITSNVGTSNVQNIPSEFNLSILTGKNLTFSSSMKGGEIIVSNISLEVPNDALSSSPFLQHDYSASILGVVNSSSIQVFPPFLKEIDYVRTDGTVGTRTFNKFISENNFTASFYDVLTLEETSFTQSYAVLNMFDLDVTSGKLDKINVSYKGLNNIGSDYQPIGTFEIRNSNLLTDSASMFFDGELGIIEKPVGNFRNGISDFQNNWVTSSISVTASKSDKIVDGIKIQQNVDFVTFRPKSHHRMQVVEGGKFTLKVDTFSERDSNLNSQLDVFISGSFVNSTFNKAEIPFSPVYSSSFGQYIGSFTANSSKNKIEFISEKAGFIQPVFVHRTGIWHIANVEISSENQSRVFVPMNINSGSEIAIKIDYLNEKNQKSRYSTILDKIFFTGSKQPGGTSVVLPDGTISGSDQLTSSFDGRYERRGNNIVSSSNQVKVLLPSGVSSGSEQFTSSYDTRYHRQGTGLLSSSNQIASDISGSFTSLSSSLSGRISVYDAKTLVSSSAQVKNLLPTGVTSGSEQLTSSYDTRYHRLGTGVITSSNQISTEISGAFVSSSNSLSGRITVFENKTLYSSSIQVNYPEISNKPSGIVSSSVQVKALLPVGVTSGSEQLTGSYDVRYHRQGTGVVSSSNQLSSDISGSFTSLSSSLSGRISVYDVKTIVSSSGQVKILLPTGVVSGSEQLTSSYDVRYHRQGTGVITSSNQIATDISGSFTSVSASLSGRISVFDAKTIVSSSAQVKNLLPTGTTSGSEQLTSSFDNRYHRLGTGIISSSNQIAVDISGSFISSSNSLSGRITVFENKTLYSSSIQVNYNEVTNKPYISGSFLGGLIFSSGSNSSSSYCDPRIKFTTTETASLHLTGSLNIQGNVYYTGSLATKFQFSWGGNITAGTTPSITWTDMPSSITTWLHTSDGAITDESIFYGGCFVGYTECNLTTVMISPGAQAGTILQVEYSIDYSTWTNLLSCTIGNTTGPKQSGWTRIPAQLNTTGSTYLRLNGRNGDGATDPRFTPPTLLFR